ncbi:MFS transporter [Streptomyces sp. NPDC006356]
MRRRGTGTAPSHRHLVVLGSLYLVQDIGYSFFFVTYAAILRSQGVSLNTLALTNIIGIVWALKFLWAPWVDRFGLPRIGHYRGWLLGTQLLMLLLLGGLALVDPVRQLPAVLTLMAALLLVSGTQENAINGLAVAVLSTGQRPMAGGLQLASAYTSAVIGSGGALFVYAQAGWAAAVGTVAAVFLVPLAVLARYREPARTAVPQGHGPGLRSLTQFLRGAGRARWALLVMPMYVCGGYLVQALVTPMLLRVDWSLSRIAFLQNTVAALVSAAVGVAAGLWTRRLGRARALLLFALLKTVALLCLLPLAAGNASDAVASCAVIGVSAATTCALSAMFTVVMDVARPEAAASDFTLQLATTSLVRLAANSGGLALAGLLGFTPLVIGGAVTTLVGAVLCEAWMRRSYPKAVEASRNGGGSLLTPAATSSG